MKLFMFFSCLALVSARMAVPDYHDEFGIPEYNRLKNAEAAMDFDGSRITGGGTTVTGVHPHLAALVVFLEGIYSICGSSLISHTRLVTAANCWRSQNHQGVFATVVLGRVQFNWLNTGAARSTDLFELHPNYDPATLNNNIAIVTISHTAYSASIRNILLPNAHLHNVNLVGHEATIAGFGDDIHNNWRNWRHLSVKIISNSECADVYGPNVVRDSNICTSGKHIHFDRPVGACKGDVGGPLRYLFEGNRVLIGVISFFSQNDCRARLPTGYSRVSSYLDWIQARM